MKKQMISIWALAVVLTPSLLFGQDAVPAPTYLDAILAYLQNLSPAVVTGVLVLVEFALRAWPSAKPLSVLVPVRYGLSGVSVIASWAAAFVDKVIIVAQNSKK
jgi:uncharacterized membrane protein (UPF0136 family)